MRPTQHMTEITDALKKHKRNDLVKLIDEDIKAVQGDRRGSIRILTADRVREMLKKADKARAKQAKATSAPAAGRAAKATPAAAESAVGLTIASTSSDAALAYNLALLIGKEDKTKLQVAIEMLGERKREKVIPLFFEELKKL